MSMAAEAVMLVDRFVLPRYSLDEKWRQGV